MCIIQGLIVHIIYFSFLLQFFEHYWSPLLNCDRLSSLPAYNCVTVTKIEKTQEYKAGPRRRVERGSTVCYKIIICAKSIEVLNLA